MAISQRLRKVETQLRRKVPDVTFWGERLRLLSDTQLERLEILFLKMIGDDDAVRLPDGFAALEAGERAELEDLFTVMGTHPEDMFL